VNDGQSRLQVESWSYFCQFTSSHCDSKSSTSSRFGVKWGNIGAPKSFPGLYNANLAYWINDFNSQLHISWWLTCIQIVHLLTYSRQHRLPLVCVGTFMKIHVPKARSSFHSSINVSTSLSDSFLGDILTVKVLKLQQESQQPTNNLFTTTEQLRHYHVIPRSAVIGCNTFASWIFSNMFESLQLLQRIACKNCMQ